MLNHSRDCKVEHWRSDLRICGNCGITAENLRRLETNQPISVSSMNVGEKLLKRIKGGYRYRTIDLGNPDG